MRVTIEDLEALKELNDELEENHLETEKAMQEEIGISHSVQVTSRPAKLFHRIKGCPNA
jgi:hypothetical protein